jgi:hypothetical protein
LETSHAIECDGAKSHEKPVNIDVCRCDVSNAENGNGHESEREAKQDLLWETVILPRRMRELGKTDSEIGMMSMEEMLNLSNESF